MYMTMNESGGFSFGHSFLGDLFLSGDRFTIGNNRLFFPTEEQHLVHFNNVEEWRAAIRRQNIRDGVKVVLYGGGAAALGFTASKAEDKNTKVTTAVSAAIMGVYAFSSAISIIERESRYVKYMRELEKQKKLEAGQNQATEVDTNANQDQTANG